jgi:hypothetical protein
MEYVIATRAVRNRRSFRSAIDAQGSPHGSLLCRACMRETRGNGNDPEGPPPSVVDAISDFPSVDAIAGRSIR